MNLSIGKKSNLNGMNGMKKVMEKLIMMMNTMP